MSELSDESLVRAYGAAECRASVRAVRGLSHEDHTAAVADCGAKECAVLERFATLRARVAELEAAREAMLAVCTDADPHDRTYPYVCLAESGNPIIEAATLADAIQQLAQWGDAGYAKAAKAEAQLATAPAAPQSTPNGWKVGAETVELFKRSYDNVKHMTAEHDVAIRAALRERTPHLLRDLADGVSDGQLRLSLDRATGGSDNLGVALLRNCLRTLADTLEGEA